MSSDSDQNAIVPADTMLVKSSATRPQINDFLESVICCPRLLAVPVYSSCRFRFDDSSSSPSIAAADPPPVTVVVVAAVSSSFCNRKNSDNSCLFSSASRNSTRAWYMRLSLVGA
jgi:hypothetical protein